MKYVYNGPGPHEDPVLGLVRPGDEHEFGAEPDWGPWLPVDAPETAAEPSGVSAPAPAPASPPPPRSAAPAGTDGDDHEGM